MDAKQIEKLVRVMRENGVSYLKSGEVELRISLPLPEEEHPSPKRTLTPQEQFAQPFFKL